MRIKTMTASFGCLDRATLELGEGLNVIQAQNEGGKSTWAGFLKAMLYGVDTRDRDRKGHLADKNRYQPWSGAPMEGEITLVYGDREITIRRGKKGSVPFGAFSAVYTDSGDPVPGLTAENCGQLLTGVGREVFERSAFIGQSGMAITSAPELERRIAALVSSGEEDVSFSQAEGRLKEWANRRRVNKTVGLIPKLEGELEQTRQALDQLERVTTAIAQAESERAALEQAKKDLETEQWAHKRLAQRDLNQRFAQAQEQFDQAQSGLEALVKEQARFGNLPEKERLRAAQGELQFLKVLDEEIKQGETALKGAEDVCEQTADALRDPHFDGVSGEEARRRVTSDLQVHQRAVNRWEKCKKRFGAFLLLAGLSLLGGLGATAAVNASGHGAQWYAAGIRSEWLLYAGCALAVVFAVLDIHTYLKGKGAKEQAAHLLAQYGVNTAEEVSALMEDYVRRWQRAQDAYQEAEQIRDTLSDRRARKEKGRTELLEFVHTFAPEVKDMFGCSAALSRALGMEDRLRESREKVELTRRRRDDLAAQGGQAMDTLEMIHTPSRSPADTDMDLDAVEEGLRQLDRALHRAKGEQAAMGDPAALAARQEELLQQLERREQEHQALTIAMEALKSANALLRERFSPELNRLAGKWLARLTGGRYTAVSLDRELEAAALEEGGLLPRKSLSLSKGTVDQLYLAVRLAVCQLCLPQDETAPLVLDDALVSFDDARMALALDCLEQLGRERQVLLFTCQEREGRCIGKKGTVIEI